MRAIRLALFTLASIALVSTATSQEAFPVRSIRLIVPYPAGGATDVVARIVAEKMSDQLGQQLFIDNRRPVRGR